METLVVGEELRSRVQMLAERLGPSHTIAAPKWRPVVDQFDLGAELAGDADASTIVVGWPAEVLDHARATDDEFGFVTPDARSVRWWQRGPSWRDDITLELWATGWSPVTIDRLSVPTHDAVFEFVVGSARRTPDVAPTP